MKLFLRLALPFAVMTAIFSVAAAGEISYDNSNRRDPFTPVKGGAGMEGSGEWSVEGIVFDPWGGSYAVIRGDIYREGDEIEGSKLVRIFPDRVILLQESREVIAWLREEIMTKKEGEA